MVVRVDSSVNRGGVAVDVSWDGLATDSRGIAAGVVEGGWVWSSVV